MDAPDRTPVFADANWLAGFGKETNQPCSDLYVGRPLEVKFNDLGRFTIARHGIPASKAPPNIGPRDRLLGTINLVLFDGHTERAELENLWNYSWHRDWQRPATRPEAAP